MSFSLITLGCGKVIPPIKPRLRNIIDFTKSKEKYSKNS